MGWGMVCADASRFTWLLRKSDRIRVMERGQNTTWPWTKEVITNEILLKHYLSAVQKRRRMRFTLASSSSPSRTPLSKNEGKKVT